MECSGSANERYMVARGSLPGGLMVLHIYTALCEVIVTLRYIKSKKTPTSQHLTKFGLSLGIKSGDINYI